MRSLTNPSRPPRAHLGTTYADDRGAVMVMVALMITLLVGIGALTIDLGSIYVEKRQLQNGADAAALAVAQDCAQGDCGTYLTTADLYADRNAHDGASAVDGVCGVGPGLTPCPDPPVGATGATGWVQVRTSTETAGGGRSVSLLLAPVLDAVTSKTVRAQATAAWGAMGSGNVTPFVFSICEYVVLGGSFDAMTFPTGTGYIYFHGANMDDNKAGSCKPNPSGQELPGGFGRVDSNRCVVGLTVGGWAGSDTGADLSKDCPLASWQGQEIVLALYDQVRKTGNNGEYHIVGFVGFRLLGYRLSGSSEYATTSCPSVKPSSLRYMCGEFTKVSTNLGDFMTGGTNYGASVIRMVG